MKLAAESERRILAALRKQSGQGVRDLIQSTGLASMTVQKRLGSLHAAGKIAFVQHTKTIRLWHLAGKPPNPRVHPLEAKVRTLMAQGKARRDIVAELGIPTSTAGFHMQRVRRGD